MEHSEFSFGNEKPGYMWVGSTMYFGIKQTLVYAYGCPL